MVAKEDEGNNRLSPSENGQAAVKGFQNIKREGETGREVDFELQASENYEEVLEKDQKDENEIDKMLEPSESEHDTPENRPDGIHKDDLFYALNSSRRRATARYLKEFDTPVDISRISKDIAGVENNKPADETTSKERKRVYTSLSQHHIEKLDDLDFVEYDSRTRTIDVGENFSVLAKFVDNDFRDFDEYVRAGDAQIGTEGYVQRFKDAIHKALPSTYRD